jgi:uncharacterized membrane protein
MSTALPPRSRAPLLAACALALLAHAAVLVPSAAGAAHTAATSAAGMAFVRLVTAQRATPAAATVPNATSALHGARPVAPAQLPQPRSTTEPGFVPAEQLDAPVVPRSAPELGRLQGFAFSGLPLKLRLFIDAQGQVVSVRVLSAHEAAQTVHAVVAMFTATAFVPGRRAGTRVPSFTDIELQLGMEG